MDTEDQNDKQDEAEETKAQFFELMDDIADDLDLDTEPLETGRLLLKLLDLEAVSRNGHSAHA
jgi:hypothetical protein